jgi:hypothetical protein
MVDGTQRVVIFREIENLYRVHRSPLSLSAVIVITFCVLYVRSP